MALIRKGGEIGNLNYVSAETYIPAIDPRAVINVQADQIDVTSWNDNTHRRFAPGLIRLYASGGQLLMEASPEFVQAAVDGGGEFWVVVPNGEHHVMTEQEYRDMIEQEADDAAREMAEW